ncbi:MAG: hypothetical protein V1837_04605 [Candidatus Woesearchaeota archaeon]
MKLEQLVSDLDAALKSGSVQGVKSLGINDNYRILLKSDFDFILSKLLEARYALKSIQPGRNQYNYLLLHHSLPVLLVAYKGVATGDTTFHCSDGLTKAESFHFNKQVKDFNATLVFHPSEALEISDASFVNVGNSVLEVAKLIRDNYIPACFPTAFASMKDCDVSKIVYYPDL